MEYIRYYSTIILCASPFALSGIIRNYGGEFPSKIARTLFHLNNISYVGLMIIRPSNESGRSRTIDIYVRCFRTADHAGHIFIPPRPSLATHYSQVGPTQRQQLYTSPLTFASFSPLSQPALPDHPPVSPFLDPRSPLTSRSPKEPYPSLHRVSGMTCHASELRTFSLPPNSSFQIIKHHLDHAPLSVTPGFPLETEVPPPQTLFL